MGRYVDLTGLVFDRLTVLERVDAKWKCSCICGKISYVTSTNLTKKNTRSCGCLRKDAKVPSGKRSPRYIDGRSKKSTVESRAYFSAKARCEHIYHRNYDNYGGRGIEFKFNSFEEFLDHIGPKPSPELSLDRINNDGHYEIGNVRWADAKTQNNNRRCSKRNSTRG